MRLRFLFILGLFVSQTAGAQSFTFKPYDGVEEDDLNQVQLSRFFNMSRCLCDAHNTDGKYSFYLGITSPGPYYDQEVYFLLGNYCDEAVSRPDCYELDSINYSKFNRQQNIYVPVNYIVDPMEGICGEARATSTLFVFMTPERDQTVASYPINFDTKPPGIPTITSAEGGESAVIVKWERPDIGDEDIEFYNVLCEINGAAPEVSSESKAEWTTTYEVCGKDLTPYDIPEPEETPDGGVEDDGGTQDLDGGMEDAYVEVDAAVPDASADVDGSPMPEGCFGNLVEGNYPRACFVCGSAGPTARDIRIGGLPNGVEVRVAVVAVDGTRNVSNISNVEVATPMPTTDFAEHYRSSGGSGEGGYCFLATAAYGSYGHSHVKLFRRFRDEVLVASTVGRSFVNWYYRNGRTLAQPFENSNFARGFLRLLLLPCVAAVYLWVNLGGLAFLFILGLVAWGLVAAGRGLRRRKQRFPAGKEKQVRQKGAAHVFRS